MIRFADIIDESVVDGLGIRVVLFLQGCLNNCEGCHNHDLKPLEGGQGMEETELAGILLDRITPMHRGITLSGGEPMLQADNLVKVISIVKSARPDLDFWLYTGHLYEEIADHPVISLVDVVVDGPFIRSQRDSSCVFYGSANQRVLDVRESRKLGKAVELKF